MSFFPGQANARYVQARLLIPDGGRPLPAGLDVVGRKGEIVRIVTDPVELANLRGWGFSVEVEIEDMERTYASGIVGPAWGIYHTLAETEALLDSLHGACPSITSAPFWLGLTHEGRPIWAMKISDRPEVDEEEPEVLIDGLHHAREVMSAEAILDLAAWLCDGYDTDPVARTIVNNRELFLVPVVNPDGMAYNEATNPSGGGMWRKNRRDNGDGTVGVDPNRNYPFQWGRDDGSSADPASNLYRGPFPASEPEVQAMIAFMASRAFVTHLSMHSYLGATLVPWGYTSSPTADDALLRAWAGRLSADNGYSVAQPAEVLYLCSGMMLDYAYGETTAKMPMISSTIEIGGSGFWPAESEVPGLIEECRQPLLHAAQSAGIWLAIAGWEVSSDDGNGRVDPGEMVEIRFRVENRAVLADADPARLAVTTDDAYVQLHDPVSSIPALAAGDTADADGVITFAVDPAAPQGHLIVLHLLATTDDFVGLEPVRLVVGRPPGLLFDDFEEGMEGWISEGGWGVTTEDAYSPTSSLTDSPHHNYADYTDSWIQLAHPLDLSSTTNATLSFWHRYDTETSYDHCVVEASADGGTTWHQVGSQYSGTIRVWKPVELSLDRWAGSQLFTLRFRLESDISITADGWYVDDVLIAGPSAGNSPPHPPTPVYPPDGSVMETSTPTLTVDGLMDPDGDPLTCGFMLYADSLFTARVAASTEIPAADGSASWTGPSLEDGSYWWRAYASDGEERGPLCPGTSFHVGIVAASPRPTAASPRLRCTPTPSRGEVTMEFVLPAPSTVRLTLHDLAGRQLRCLAAGEFPAGGNRVIWDGRDDRSRNAPPGVYVARVHVPGNTTERFVVLSD